MTKLQETLDCPFKTNDPEYLVQLSCGRHFADPNEWKKHKEQQGLDEPPCPYCKQPVTDVGSPLPMRIINQYIQNIKSQCTKLDEVLKRNQDAANLNSYSRSQPQTISKIPNNQDFSHPPNPGENVTEEAIDRPGWQEDEQAGTNSNRAISSVNITVWTPGLEEIATWPGDENRYLPLPLEIPDPMENSYDLYDSFDEINDAHIRAWGEMKENRNKSPIPVSPVKSGNDSSLNLSIPNTHTVLRTSTERARPEPERKSRVVSEPPISPNSSVGRIRPKERMFGRCALNACGPANNYSGGRQNTNLTMQTDYVNDGIAPTFKFKMPKIFKIGRK